MDRETDSLRGIAYAAAAYFLWGFLPLYWKPLDTVSSLEILAHRIVWSFVFMIAILMVLKRINRFVGGFKNLFLERVNFLSVFAASILISANWLIYIWAVNSNHVIETSFGYYINPLLSVLLGVIVLKEKLNRWQVVSFILAAIGVAILTVQYGKIPWVALSLALTFGLYGLAKKLGNVDSLTGLTYETMFVTPLAVIFLIYAHMKGTGSFAVVSTSTSLLLAGSGVFTAVPLLCFAEGAKRITLSMVGFLQYIAPTIMLLLGIFVFKEGFSPVQFVSFLFIWLALILFSLSRTKIMTNMLAKREVNGTASVK